MVRQLSSSPDIVRTAIQIADRRTQPSAATLDDFLERLQCDPGKNGHSHRANLAPRRLSEHCAQKVAEMMYTYSSYERADVESDATGVCAEAVTGQYLERAVDRFRQVTRTGVDCVVGDYKIDFNGTTMCFDGRNVVIQHGNQSAELDGCIIVGDEGQEVMLYDVTTSAWHLSTKLREGETFFSRLREDFARRHHINLTKTHFLVERTGPTMLRGSGPPFYINALAPTATPAAGVYVMTLPIRREVFALRKRTMATLEAGGLIETSRNRRIRFA